jgi:hypothetical protein
VPEYEARFMELLRYAPHLNTEKLKVNKFVFGLNFNIRVKVRILMPQTLHDAVQKALIAEEELTKWGSGKDSCKTDWTDDIRCATTSDTSQTYIRVSRYVERIHVHDTMMTDSSAEDSLQRTTTSTTTSSPATTIV